jgi:hypothetical protein
MLTRSACGLKARKTSEDIAVARRRQREQSDGFEWDADSNPTDFHKLSAKLP